MSRSLVRNDATIIPRAIVHPPAGVQLPHGRIDDRITGPPLAPGFEKLCIILPTPRVRTPAGRRGSRRAGNARGPPRKTRATPVRRSRSAPARRGQPIAPRGRGRGSRSCRNAGAAKGARVASSAMASRRFRYCARPSGRSRNPVASRLASCSPPRGQSGPALRSRSGSSSLAISGGVLRSRLVASAGGKNDTLLEPAPKRSKHRIGGAIRFEDRPRRRKITIVKCRTRPGPAASSTVRTRSSRARAYGV